MDEARKQAINPDLNGLLLWFLPRMLILVGSIATLSFLGVAIPTLVHWLFFVVTVPLGFLSLRFFNVAILKWQAGGLVAINRCASCGYNLQKLPAAEDGCTICPECGAAWKL